MNIDLNKTNVVSNEYINSVSSSGFTSLINQPTRIYHYLNSNSVSCTTIDHIITNCGSNFRKTGILVSDIADHLPIFAYLNLSKLILKQNNKEVPRRFIRVRKKDDFLKSLGDKLKRIENVSDPNVMFNKILNSTRDAIMEIFPAKIPSKTQKLSIENPWFDKPLSDLQRTRDKLKSKWIKLGKQINSIDHLEYKKIRNKFTNLNAETQTGINPHYAELIVRNLTKFIINKQRAA